MVMAFDATFVNIFTSTSDWDIIVFNCINIVYI